MTFQEIYDGLDYTKAYRVTFYELENDCGSWAVNRPWVANSKATKREIKELLRCRLLVFRENYLKPKRQKVRFEDISDTKEKLDIECNGIPFAWLQENE